MACWRTIHFLSPSQPTFICLPAFNLPSQPRGSTQLNAQVPFPHQIVQFQIRTLRQGAHGSPSHLHHREFAARTDDCTVSFEATASIWRVLHVQKRCLSEKDFGNSFGCVSSSKNTIQIHRWSKRETELRLRFRNRCRSAAIQITVAGFAILRVFCFSTPSCWFSCYGIKTFFMVFYMLLQYFCHYLLFLLYRKRRLNGKLKQSSLVWESSRTLKTNKVLFQHKFSGARAHFINCRECMFIRQTHLYWKVLWRNAIFKAWIEQNCCLAFKDFSFSWQRTGIRGGKSIICLTSVTF